LPVAAVHSSSNAGSAGSARRPRRSLTPPSGKAVAMKRATNSGSTRSVRNLLDY